ncbi:MAG TPA: acetone carboxylase subunit gamma [Dehalococcoidia bacterium]|nr:acetone carboxylase subunit gamma [Dehalococcoidia bacterium]
MVERNDTAEIEALVDGRLPWTRVQEIMKAPKDVARFDQWIEILQKRVSWPERILLPLTPRLSIVQKGSERIVKCACGQEFGDYRVNWKLSALIYVRDTEEALGEVYRGWELPDADWMQLREYYCHGCGAQLEVEAVPRGCPPDFEFLPDLDAFYRDWLGRPLPDEKEFVDKTLETVQGWQS